MDWIHGVGLGLLLPACLLMHGVGLLVRRSGNLRFRLTGLRVEGFDAVLGGVLVCSLAGACFCVFWLGRSRPLSGWACVVGPVSAVGAVVGLVWLFLRSAW